MCEYCNKPYKNISISEGYIKIRKSKYSPSGYSLCEDTSDGEYIGNCDNEQIETSSAEVHIFAENEEDREVLEKLHGLQ